MRLHPKQPPGRATRKALTFASDIVALRAEGYSLEAIRRALADAGVEVSLSTVRREAVRGSAKRELAAAQRSRHSPPAVIAAAPPIGAANNRSGPEIAEEFMKDRVDNPLIRGRSNS